MASLPYFRMHSLNSSDVVSLPNRGCESAVTPSVLPYNGGNKISPAGSPPLSHHGMTPAVAQQGPLLATPTVAGGLCSAAVGATPQHRKSPPVLDPVVLALECHSSPMLMEALEHLRQANLPMATQNGTPALIAAFRYGAPLAVCEKLLAMGCSGTGADRNGLTPLHWIALLNKPSYLSILLPYLQQADFNDESQNHETALIMAARLGYESMCGALIAAGADVNYVARNNRTALMVAYFFKQQNTETFLVQSGAAPLFISDLYGSIRAYRKAMKMALMATGTLQPLPLRIQRPTTCELVAAQIFVTDPSLRERLLGAVDDMYSIAALRPQLHAMALAACGKFVRGNDGVKRKKLKIFCVPDLNALMPQFPDLSARNGMYTFKHTILVRCDAATFDYNACLNTLTHEGMHFVMQQVFGNCSEPYYGGDDAQKRYFDGMAMNIQKRLPFMEQTSEEHRAAFCVIEGVFRFYEPRDFNRELIVRCPEILMRIGFDRGSAWLQANVPDLYAYYLGYVNEEIMAYVRAHASHRFLHDISGTLPAVQQQ